jgi:hypothetical protein
MSIPSEVADMYALMRWRGASVETARAVAVALYRELVPGSDHATADEAVSRAIATAPSPATHQKAPTRGASSRPPRRGAGGDDAALSDFLIDDSSVRNQSG